MGPVVEAFESSGVVAVRVSVHAGDALCYISPDEARLLGLRLIKLADRAEDDE